MSIQRALCLALVSLVALTAGMALLAGGPDPAQAQAEKPPVPTTAPPTGMRSPLALDSNAQPLTILPAKHPASPLATPPPNDAFSQALSISGIPYAFTEDTTLATTQAEDPLQSCTGNPPPPDPRQNKGSVWFVYTAPSNAPLVAYTIGSSYDTVLSALTGTFGDLDEVACNDDIAGSGTFQSRITFTPTAGTTYYFDVTTWYGATNVGGNLVFRVRDATVPTNDDFNAATIIEQMPFADERETFNATTASDDPTLPCPSPLSRHSSSVWYRYTATQGGTLTVETVGSNYDTVLAVWTGVRGSLSNVACNDDFSGQQSRVQVSIIPGVTYHIEVVSKGTTPGEHLLLSARLVIPQWQTVAPMALARDRLAVVADGFYVYALGGERYFTDSPLAYEPVRNVARYNPGTNSWLDRQPMPTPLENHAAVHIAGKIYIPSGYAGSGPPFFGGHLVYDIAANSWSTAASAPWANGRPPIFYSAAADLEGYYVTGGYDGALILNTVWYYHVASNSWTARASMPGIRYGHNSALINGQLVVVAGDNDSTLPGLFSTLRYDPASNSWGELPAQHQDRVFGAAGLIPSVSGPGKWYLTGGGFSSFGTLLASTEVYDPVANQWTVLPEEYNLAVARYLLGGAVLNSAFYAVGGFDNSTPGTLAVTERLLIAQPTDVNIVEIERLDPPSAAWIASVLMVLAVGVALRKATRIFARS